MDGSANGNRTRRPSVQNGAEQSKSLILGSACTRTEGEDGLLMSRGDATVMPPPRVGGCGDSKEEINHWVDRNALLPEPLELRQLALQYPPSRAEQLLPIRIVLRPVCEDFATIPMNTDNWAGVRCMVPVMSEAVLGD